MTTIGTSEASSHTVYAAIELSKKTWVLGIATPERDPPDRRRQSAGPCRSGPGGGEGRPTDSGLLRGGI